MSKLRHIYRNLKLKHIPSKRYNRKYDPKYLDELASKGCSVKLGFGDFDGDYDLDGTYPKQRAAVAEKPGIYMNRPLRGPHSMSAIPLPAEGPLVLESVVIKPALGPTVLSSITELPVQGPSTLETETVKPFGGPQTLVSTTVVPAEGPASMQAVPEPANGPLSLNSTIVIPAAGPASISSTVTLPTNSPLSLVSTIVAPANGPVNIGSTVSVASSGPTNLASTTVAPANGPTFGTGQGAVIDNQLPNETTSGTGSSTPQGTSLTISIPFDSFADEYEVVYSTNENDPNLANNTSNKTTVTATSSGGSLTITSIPDTVYYFKVRAVNELTDSVYGWPETPQNYRTNVMNSLYFSRGGFMARNADNTIITTVNPGTSIFDFEFFGIDEPGDPHVVQDQIYISTHRLASFGGVLGDFNLERIDNYYDNTHSYKVGFSGTIGFPTQVIEPGKKYRLLASKTGSNATAKVKISLKSQGETGFTWEKGVSSGGWNLPYFFGSSAPGMSWRLDQYSQHGAILYDTWSMREWGTLATNSSHQPYWHFYGPSKYATSGSRDGVTPSGIEQSGNRTIFLDEFYGDAYPNYNTSGKINNIRDNAVVFRDAKPYDPMYYKNYTWTRSTNTVVRTDKFLCFPWDSASQTGRFSKVEDGLLYVRLMKIDWVNGAMQTSWITRVVPLDHLSTTSRNLAESLAANAGEYFVDNQNTGFGRLGSMGTTAGLRSGIIDYDDYYYTMHPSIFTDSRDWSLSSGEIDVDVSIPYSSLPNIQITEIPNPPSEGPSGLSSADLVDPNADFVYINVTTNFGHTEAMPRLFNGADPSITGFAEVGERNKSVSEFAYSKNNTVQFRAPYHANAVANYDNPETPETPRNYYFWVLKTVKHVEQHYNSTTTHTVTFSNASIVSTDGTTIPLEHLPGVSEGRIFSGEIEYSSKEWPQYDSFRDAYEYTIIEVPLITSSYTLGAGGGSYEEANFTKGSEWNLQINYSYSSS